MAGKESEHSPLKEGLAKAGKWAAIIAVGLLGLAWLV